MHPHLTDEALNEYLDAALPDAGTEAHLAACPPCAARLDALRALFASLDALPDAPLTRSLAPAVLQALPAPAPARRPTPTPARSSLPWLVTAGQALAAVLLLALAWPLIAQLFGALSWPDSLTAPAAWLASLPSLAPSALLAQAQAWLRDVSQWLAALAPWPAQQPWLALTGLAPLTIGLAVAVAAALWLVGNALLLRRSFTPLLRRRA